ncbi:FAD-dependent oxidoreductase [Gilvimarinus polysaccharolyticus]|uniref:FAD-dependent oxidoreductase n=1 Tax=Gilvimarinus polysaccharolyticus TaxID=863921 RepID=UPI000673C48C|nr:FAD-dependent oxidoreductase [Gilvimarinus polysaccharolyticus]
MIRTEFSKSSRSNRCCDINVDLVVAGGGLSGVCAAISAARSGVEVILVQDRPVLGGNASSEVRLWALGATSHMGNNNRYSREGGVIDEIMLENTYRNPMGNPLIFDAVLLDKVVAEKNITLLLNTAVYQVNKSTPSKIESCDAFCSQNSIHYRLNGKVFIDATGDGLLAFNAGASFRIGAEGRDEFSEGMAPAKPNSDLLGHSLFFYSKRMNYPVAYQAPDFAYTQEEIGSLPRSKDIKSGDSGCKFWWLEYGGIHDTVYDTEDIKWELWKIVYGVWDYIKNSGRYSDVENLTLEWVGTIPGKRESRRFEGEYMLKQQDIVEQREFSDVVSYGGWAIDLHPAEGVYSDKPACSQYHAKGVYQIPFRSFLSRDIDNLLLSGRIISASHIAFGSTRVMLTCAHGGQAMGQAAAMCVIKDCEPKSLLEPPAMAQLQQSLNLTGHGLPGIALNKQECLSQSAKIVASSTYSGNSLGAVTGWTELTQSLAQMLPLAKGKLPVAQIKVKALRATTLTVQYRISEKAQNFTPEAILAFKTLSLIEGEQDIVLDLPGELETAQYAFLCFMANDAILLATTERRLSAIATVRHKEHKAVSNTGKQIAPPDSGIDEFEIWTPERRPDGHNLALSFSLPVSFYTPANLTNGFTRPWLGSNAWVCSSEDPAPEVKFLWDSPVRIESVRIFFDCDYDHALETVLMEHPENIMPFCIRRYRLLDDQGRVVYESEDNHQSVNVINFSQFVDTEKLIVQMEHPSQQVPAGLFEVHIQGKHI